MAAHQATSPVTLVAPLLMLLCTSNLSYAGPAIKICLNDNCKKPYNINISDACWSDIEALFSAHSDTEKNEQDNIANAIALLKFDTYHSLVKKISFTNNAEDLYANNSNKNNYRNIKNYIGVLLDHYLVRHHVVRKTIIQNSWVNYEINGLLLQSLTNSKLYVLESNTSNLRATPLIKSYKITSKVKTEDTLKPNNETLNNDDFE